MRKGMLILSDIVWFIVFALVALLFYLFLFGSVGAEKEQVHTTGVANDAAFIATTLPNMKVTGTQASPYAGKTFADIIQAYAEAKAKNHDTEPVIKDYEAFLKGTFEKEEYRNKWTLDDRDIPICPSSYTVVLRSGGSFHRETCKQFKVNDPSGNVCNALNNAKTIDPDTGLDVPEVLLGGAGTSHIATDNGPMTVHVFIEYHAEGRTCGPDERRMQEIRGSVGERWRR